MKKKVLIFDTSVLCVWLKVPGKETCGQEGNQLTFEVVDAKIEDEKKQGTTFVLPIDVANYYASAGFEVEIFTGDEGLKAYEPVAAVIKPRRRQ